MSKIPNNIHIIYGLSKTFGWGEYEHLIMTKFKDADKRKDIREMCEEMERKLDAI